MTEPRNVLLDCHYDVSWRQVNPDTGELTDWSDTWWFGDDEETARRCHASMLTDGPLLWHNAHLMRDVIVGDLVQTRRYRVVNNAGKSHWREDKDGTITLAAGGPVEPPDAVQPTLDVDTAVSA